MKLLEVSSRPMKTQQGTFRQQIICYKIQNDEDAKEYAEALSEGVQILPSADNGRYMFIQKQIKLPFDLHDGSNKNLAKK